MQTESLAYVKEQLGHYSIKTCAPGTCSALSWQVGSTETSKTQLNTCLTKNRIFKERLGKRRILLNDDQRRRLVVKAKPLARRPRC
jgi:hypothetical protein